MNLRALASILFVCLMKVTLAQLSVGRDTITVYENNKVLKMPWAGGLNSCIFSQTDLNADGKQDLVVFDKVNYFAYGHIRCYLNSGGTGETKYTYAPDFTSKFPKVEQWKVLADYNNDGKSDLFTYVPGGIKVFKNTSTGSNLSFQLFKTTLISNITPTTSASYAPVFSGVVAIPAINDIDSDGDLDILTFGTSGYQIEFHKNRSQETYSNSDSLEFELVDKTWGNIYENNCSLVLNQFFGSATPNEYPNKTIEVHAGACLTCFDNDGDGDKDLLMGDISCTFNHFCHNGGTASNAHITDTTKLFPNYPSKANTTVIKMDSYPCSFYLDVDNDNKKDLIVSPNILNSENQSSVWFYKNNASTGADFQMIKKNFLQDEMIELGEGAYPVVFDADNDGLNDLIIGNAGYYNNGIKKTQLAYYRNIGTLSQPSFSLITRDYANLSAAVISYTLTSLVPTFGDIDGDGDKDMVLGDYFGKIHWVENTAGIGNPCNFSLFHYNDFGITTTSGAPYPQLIDVDRDGVLDLLIGLRNGRLAYYKNTGTTSTPTFSMITNTFGNVNVKGNPALFSSDGSCAPFLFDDGGTYKLLCGSISGNIFYYDNIDGNLTGNFNRIDTNVNKINDGPNSTVQFVDINNDGKRDLFCGNYAGGLSFYSSKNAIGINELNAISELDVLIYPNPNNGEFYIHGNKKEALKISNELGQILQTIELSKDNNYSSKIKINTTGVYFLHGNSSAKKIVVVK